MGNLRLYFFFFIFSSLLLIYSSCEELPTEDSITEEAKKGVYALPILNDTLRITDLFNSDGYTNYSLDQNGRITVRYSGDVLTEDADQVAPPVFGFGDILIADTVFQLDYGMGSFNTIDSAVIERDYIQFRYESTFQEPITVTTWIEEMSLNGNRLQETVVIPASDGTKIEIKGEKLSMIGHTLQGNDNKLTFKYDARKANGERVKLTKVYANFNILEFSYLQGYFPKTVKPVEGQFVPVGLYDNWLSGTMIFEDPKISIGVKNSFGFPVGTKFNEMILVTLEDEEFALESDQLEEGIEFDYPSLDEVGEEKFTSFYFDKDNSNLPLLFENRIKRLDYNIDAIANPQDIQNFIGFLTKDSYYSVDLTVEIPMHLTIDNLVLTDTLDFRIDQENELLDSLEIKLILENTYPVDVDLEAYLLDAQNQVIDTLFPGGKLHLLAADVTSDGDILDFDKNISFYNYSNEKIDQILKTKKIIIRSRISSVEKYNEPIWLYNDYGITIKSGIRFILQ